MTTMEIFLILVIIPIIVWTVYAVKIFAQLRKLTDSLVSSQTMLQANLPKIFDNINEAIITINKKDP